MMRNRSGRTALGAVVMAAALAATSCSMPEERSDRYELPSTTRPPTTVVASEGLFPGAGGPSQSTSTVPMRAPITVPAGTPKANLLNELMLGFEESTTQLEICAAIQRPIIVLDGEGIVIIPEVAADPGILQIFLTSVARAFTHFAQIVPDAMLKPFETLALAFQSLTRIDPTSPDAQARTNQLLQSTEVRNAGRDVITWLATNCGGALAPDPPAAAPQVPEP